MITKKTKQFRFSEGKIGARVKLLAMHLHA